MEKKTGIELIAEERKRQVEVEDWTPQHDDTHESFELGKAAACYEQDESDRKYRRKKGKKKIVDHYKLRPKGWPWRAHWWKPSPEDRVKELVKAGALYTAEKDRIERRIQIIATAIDRFQSQNP